MDCITDLHGIKNIFDADFSDYTYFFTGLTGYIFTTKSTEDTEQEKWKKKLKTI